MSHGRKSDPGRIDLYSRLKPDVLQTIDPQETRKRPAESPFPESFIGSLLPYGDRKEMPDKLKISFDLVKHRRKMKVRTEKKDVYAV